MQRTAALRQANLRLLTQLGFRVAPSLPVVRGPDECLRPPLEIAARLVAIDTLFSWVALSEDQATSDQLRARADRDGIEAWLSEGERAVWGKPRADAHAEDTDSIGWKLENLWALAWVLGFEPAPPVSGAMIDQQTIEALLFDFSPSLEEPLASFAARCRARSEAEVVEQEDLFYCAHNAARSAQLGRPTVPEGFDPIAGGGVIHERRHAFTWCLSPGVPWDETDLST
jgi:hypothetical protein